MLTTEPDGRRRFAEPGPEARPPGRRPQLDGLRALAVYLVVAFHSGLNRFQGGFIGVDVFFVLSGYLVTQVLLRDVTDGGPLRFGRFYARRVRRLLPAALIMLTLTAITYRAIATPAQVQEAMSAFRAAYLYVANWHFITQSTSYFAADTEASPVLQMWTLSVEEQFYLAWPLLFGALLWASSRLGSGRDRAVRLAVGAGALASMGWALALRTTQPDRAYLGTDTRAYQLLAGALLALTPTLFARVGRVRRLPSLMALGGVAVLVALAVTAGRLDPIERGIGATAATALVLLGLDAVGPNPIGRLLSLPFVVYLGQVSYGTYLWHWPLILALTEAFDLSARSLAVVVALVATGLASLSYQLVEMPIRRARRLDTVAWPVVAVGLSLSVVAAVVVLPRIDGNAARPSQTVAIARTGAADGFTPVPDDLDEAAITAEGFGTTVECVGRAPEACTVVQGTGRHIMLMGDSNAQMWIPAFTEVAKDRNLSLSLAITPACAWQRGVNKPFAYGSMANCDRNRSDAYDRVIPALDPDLIVVVNTREPHGPPQRQFVDNRYNRALRDSTPASLGELATPGREVLIIGEAPLPEMIDVNPLSCLAKADVVEACRFVADATTTWLDRVQVEAASDIDGVTMVDFDRLICPFLPICDPVIGDTVTFWNQEHITARFSRSLAPDVERYLQDQGFIP